MIFEKLMLKEYGRRILVRHDPDGWSRYFSPEDFEGLCYERFTFPSAEGVELVAYAYYYETKDTAHPLVFDHGMGPGHRSYMRDIAYLASRGFTVLTYDHTGTRESGGENIRALSQSLSDLDAFLTYLKSTEEYGAADFRVIGHSWGGFSTYNIAAYHPEVTHVVPISGFRSVRAMLEDQMGGVLRCFIPAVLSSEREKNPRFADADAVDSLSRTRAKLFAVHSIDDPVVSYTTHFASVESALSEREGSTFVSFHDLAHNPYNTPEAVAYLNEFFDNRAKMQKKKRTTEEEKAAFVAGYDFTRMTEPNVALWDEVCEFLRT